MATTQSVKDESSELREQMQALGFKVEQTPSGWVITADPFWKQGDRVTVSQEYENGPAALQAFSENGEAIQRRRDTLREAYWELLQDGFQVDRAGDGWRLVGMANGYEGNETFSGVAELLDKANDIISADATRLDVLNGGLQYDGFAIRENPVKGFDICVRGEQREDIPIKHLPLIEGIRSGREAVLRGESDRTKLFEMRKELRALQQEFASVSGRMEQVDGGWKMVGYGHTDPRVFSSKSELLRHSAPFVAKETEHIRNQWVTSTDVPDAATLETTDASHDANVAAIQKFVEGRSSLNPQPGRDTLLLCGSENAPKIASAALVSLAKEHRPGKYMRLWDAVDAVEEIDAQKLRSVLQFVHPILHKADVLLLDLTGVPPADTWNERATVWGLRPAFNRIFRERWSAHRATIVVADVSADTLRRQFGPQIYADLQEHLAQTIEVGQSAT